MQGSEAAVLVPQELHVAEAQHVQRVRARGVVGRA